MLSSSQVQYIEDAIKAGKTVKVFDLATVFKVEYPTGEMPVLMMMDGLALSAKEVKASRVFIGNQLSSLRPN